MTLFRASLIRLWGILGVALILAGCAAPGGLHPHANRIPPSAQSNLVVFCFGTNLDLRVQMRGHEVFAHASWEAPDSADTNFQHRFARLDFSKEALAARRATEHRINRLPVYSAAQWHDLLGKVFAQLAPAEPNHAVLLLLPNYNMAVYRDAALKPRVVKLQNKPPEVIAEGTCNGAEFARAAAQLLESAAGPADVRSRQFLFATGTDPAFVLLDARQRLIVFLDYPADPEAEEFSVPFALRAFNTLFLRGILVTAVKNPVSLVCRGFWHLGVSGAAAVSSMGGSPEGPLPPSGQSPPMDLSAWENDLDHIVSARRYKGQIEPLIDGEQFFPALMQSMANASRGIDVLVYIFDTDDYAVTVANLLKEKSRYTRVRVLLDDIGSLFAAQNPPDSPMPAEFQRPPSIQYCLKQDSRVSVRVTANPWLTVDHRKCFIIDDRDAYVGGMNIGRNYRYDWHDMMVRLRGPVVGRLERDYRLAWAHAGPFGDFGYAWAWLFDRSFPRKNTLPGAIDIRPLRTSTGSSQILRAQSAAIEHARRYIYIETPYFDDEASARALIRARLRGVDVRVIFPERNDSGVMQLNNGWVADELLRNGVRVYAYPGMTHVKAAIYDGWACVGSANFDKMSLRVSQELDVAFSDRAAVAKLKAALFDKDFARSREMTGPGAETWFDTLLKAFTNQL